MKILKNCEWNRNLCLKKRQFTVFECLKEHCGFNIFFFFGLPDPKATKLRRFYSTFNPNYVKLKFCAQIRNFIAKTKVI